MRNKNLDNAKWILTLLMVLYHIQFRGDERYYFGFMLIKNFGDCVVPAFAIISGFLFWSTVRGGNDLKGKYKRRVNSLLLPYVIWNLINVPFFNFSAGERGINLLDANLYVDIMMGKSSPHFWYIFMLMFWTLLSPILFVLYRKSVLGKLTLGIITATYLICKGNSILHSRFIYFLYVWAGLVGYYYPNLIKKICFDGKKKHLIASVSIIAYVGIYFVYCNKTVGMGTQVWLYGIRALVLIVGVLNVPFVKIGALTNYNYSFWLFAVHYWLDVYLGHFISRYVSNAYLYQAITWTTVTVLGVIAGVTVKRLMPNAFRILTGSRGY